MQTITAAPVNSRTTVTIPATTAARLLSLLLPPVLLGGGLLVVLGPTGGEGPLATESGGFVVVSSEEKGETVGEGEKTNKVGSVAVLNVALTECCT